MGHEKEREKRSKGAAEKEQWKLREEERRGSEEKEKRLGDGMAIEPGLGRKRCCRQKKWKMQKQ